MFAFPSFLVKMDRGGAQAPEWGPGRLGQPLGRLLALAASGGRLRPRRRPRPYSGIPPVAGAALGRRLQRRRSGGGGGR